MTKREIPRQILTQWAAAKPTIKALSVFGSYARGAAESDSDLDLAFEFTVAADDALSELICNAQAWKAELTELTGIVVKDLCLSTDAAARGQKVLVFSREEDYTLLPPILPQ
jgi:predicted nucleotidyltransferase